MHWAYESFAVAWMPDPGTSLAAFGRSWTGWCAEGGERCDMPASVDELRLRAGASAPDGFAALLVPPFRLRRDTEFWRLEDRLAEIAEDMAGFRMPRLAVGVLDGAVVLLPAVADERISALRARVARLLRPLGDTDGAAADEAALLRPFHLPLTGPLSQHEAEGLARSLALRLESLLAERQRFADLALLGAPGAARPLRTLDRFRFQREVAATGSGSLDCLGPAMLTTLAPAGLWGDRIA